MNTPGQPYARWHHCKPGQFRRVNFVLGPAIVHLLSTFVYSRSVETPGGRVYHVENVLTRRRDTVGAEYLKRIL